MIDSVLCEGQSGNNFRAFVNRRGDGSYDNPTFHNSMGLISNTAYGNNEFNACFTASAKVHQGMLGFYERPNVTHSEMKLLPTIQPK